MISQSIIDEILSKTTLSVVVNEFVSLKKDGVNFRACCPFHKEDSPSFTVNDEKGLYKCFGCGKAGSAITFLIEHKQMTFPDSVKFLAEKAKVYFNEEKKEYKKPQPWRNKTQLSDRMVQYWEGRKINQNTLKKFQVGEGIESMPVKGGGFKDLNTIQFPYFRDEELVNIKFRGPRKEFKLVSGAELIFFNLNAIKGTKRAIIVEGEPDCMTIDQCGFPEVVSVPNGASVSGKINLEYLDNCIEYFLDKEEIIIATDDDVAGRRLMEALSERLGKERCYKVKFKIYKDANECLVKETEGTQAVIESIADKQEFALTGIFTVSDHSKEIEDIYDNGLPKGARTQLGNLNRLVTFHKGYITTITGIPNMGKSDALDQITLGLSLTSEWKGAFYSPENKPTSLHITKLARKLVGKAWQGENKITKQEIELAKDYLNDKYYFIKPENNFTIDSILGYVKQLVLRKGIDYFVVDAWNKLEHKYTNDENKYIGESLDKLSTFCDYNKVHLFIVAHPRKMMKDKQGRFEVPNLYDINGSANWFNKSDNGICVHRDYDNEVSNWYVQKVKFSHWGKTGMCQMKYDMDSGRFNEFSGGALVNYDKTPWISGIKTTPKSADETQDKGIIINQEEPPF